MDIDEIFRADAAEHRAVPDDAADALARPLADPAAAGAWRLADGGGIPFPGHAPCAGIETSLGLVR